MNGWHGRIAGIGLTFQTAAVETSDQAFYQWFIGGRGPAGCYLSRSPLAGTTGDSSVGGWFETELKKAGFDGVIITGFRSTAAWP